jgi:serine/threonine protein phosphatase PrpC
LGTDRPLLAGSNINEQADWLNQESPRVHAGECQSAATCLFVAVLPSGQLTIAQLGDGIAAIRNADGSLEILQGERQGFTNQTTGLGIAKTTKDWTVIAKPALSPNAAVLLATDGIADDLVADRVGDFIHTLVTEFGSMAPTARRHALHRELRNWATPNHLDDKTLAAIWRKQAEGEDK